MLEEGGQSWSETETNQQPGHFVFLALKEASKRPSLDLNQQAHLHVVPAGSVACGLTSLAFYASINVKPEGGHIWGICGAFDFSRECLVKIPTMGPQNLVKSD